MKKYLVFAVIAMSLIFGTRPVGAQDPYPQFIPGTTIADGAGILTQDDVAKLTVSMEDLKAKFLAQTPLPITVTPVVLTVSDRMGIANDEKYCNGFFEARGLRKSTGNPPQMQTDLGVIAIVVDMQNRYVTFCAGSTWDHITAGAPNSIADQLTEKFIMPNMGDGGQKGAAMGVWFQEAGKELDLFLNPPPTPTPQPAQPPITYQETTQVNTEGLGKGIAKAIGLIVLVAALSTLLYVGFAIVLPAYRRTSNLLAMINDQRGQQVTKNVDLLSAFPSKPEESIFMADIMLVMGTEKPGEAEKLVKKFLALRDEILSITDASGALKRVKIGIFTEVAKLQQLLKQYGMLDERRGQVTAGKTELEKVSEKCRIAASEAPKAVAEAVSNLAAAHKGYQGG